MKSGHRWNGDRLDLANFPPEDALVCSKDSRTNSSVERVWYRTRSERDDLHKREMKRVLEIATTANGLAMRMQPETSAAND